MRRKLSAAAALVFMLACCLAAAAAASPPQGDPTTVRRRPVPRSSPGRAPRAARRRAPREPGASLGERLTAAVSIKNFEFQPKKLTVKPGTIVTWTNDAGSHTVTADNGSFSSPTLAAGQTFSHKFARRGTYRYYCSFHGGAGGHDMAGTVVVQP